MTIIEDGHRAIKAAVLSVPDPVIVLEMARMFGDVLHSTIVVRHYAKTKPCSVVWAISERYVPQFELFRDLVFGPSAIAALPELPPYPDDGPFRVEWVKRARELPGVERALGLGVHPWGWKGGTIVDAILHNAEISYLGVERRPVLYISEADEACADAVAPRPYIAMECNAGSVQAPPIEFFEALVEALPIPTVALAAEGEPIPPNAIDGRGTSFRVAKAVIQRAACFVGCGSGLSVLAASKGCEQPMVELCSFELCAVRLGYREAGPTHICLEGPRTPGSVVEHVIRMIGDTITRSV